MVQAVANEPAGGLSYEELWAEYERFFRETDGQPVVFAIQSHLLALRTREHLQDRVRYYLWLARYTMTPNALDRALLPLPAPLFPFYYLLRPIRLTVAYGPILLRWLRQNWCYTRVTDGVAPH